MIKNGVEWKKKSMYFLNDVYRENKNLKSRYHFKNRRIINITGY